jgi:hypothetical protein
MNASRAYLINNNGSGGGSLASIIWRPGVPSAGSTVATWAEVETYIAATSGNLIVQLDTSIAPAIVPPTADTECFGRLAVVGYTLNLGALNVMIIADGGRLRNLSAVKSCGISCVTTLHEALLQNLAGSVLITREGGQISMEPGSTVSAIRISATFCEVATFEGATINNSTGNPLLAVVAIDPGNVALHAVISQAGTPAGSGGDAYSPQTFAGDATTTLLEILDSSAPLVPQTLFLGTVQPVPMSTAQGTVYLPGAPADWVGPAPTLVSAALDRLAAAVAGLLGGPIP